MSEFWVNVMAFVTLIAILGILVLMRASDRVISVIALGFGVRALVVETFGAPK
jgi:hypothetical protein